MGILDELIETVKGALTGRGREPRPASEDPDGDPAGQGGPTNVRPASEDPDGDPAGQERRPDTRPASEDPYGDPAGSGR